jgi:hypothetical protein
MTHGRRFKKLKVLGNVPRHSTGPSNDPIFSHGDNVIDPKSHN